MKLTVSCVFVNGHVPFTKNYVTTLRSMVARILSVPHEFLCLTDRPHLFKNEGISTVEIPSPAYGVFAWWRKLHLFDPSIPQLQSGRCLYLDLDTLVIKDLDQIALLREPMALVADDAPSFHGKGARVTVKRFNSSVMVWDGGKYNSLFTDFKVSVSRRLWGDQDWIGERLGDAVAMPKEWFPRLSQCMVGPTPEAKVVLCKKPKNSEAIKSIPWVKKAWQ